MPWEWQRIGRQHDAAFSSMAVLNRPLLSILGALRDCAYTRWHSFPGDQYGLDYSGYAFDSRDSPGLGIPKQLLKEL